MPAADLAKCSLFSTQFKTKSFLAVVPRAVFPSTFEDARPPPHRLTPSSPGFSGLALWWARPAPRPPESGGGRSCDFLIFSLYRELRGPTVGSSTGTQPLHKCWFIEKVFSGFAGSPPSSFVTGSHSCDSAVGTHGRPCERGLKSIPCFPPNSGLGFSRTKVQFQSCQSEGSPKQQIELLRMFTGLEGLHGARARCSLKGSPCPRPHGRHQDWWGDRHHRDKRRPPMHFEHASPERDLLQMPRVQGPLKDRGWCAPHPHTDSGHHRVKRAGRREPETSSDSWSHRAHTRTSFQTPRQFLLPWFRLLPGN